MAQYLAGRIMSGALQYAYVISKRPDLKEQIDAILIANGKQDLIV